MGMKQTVESNRSARETDGSLADRVRRSGILDIVSAEAPLGEAKGQLTDTTVAALNSLGLFGLLVPACFGGYEAGAIEALEIWEMVSEADGSAGWVLMACGAGSGVCSAFLSDAGAQAIFGDRIAIIGGQGAPRGRATVDGDGYRLTGTWGYGSGTLHADYVMSSARIINHDGSSGGMRSFVLPASEVQFQGNWDVIGLRATGSVDYSLDDAYVPKEFAFQLESLEPLRGNGLLRTGVVGSTPLGHSGFALGVGRRILTEIAALANSGDGKTSALADGGGELFRNGYGASEGKLRAARAFLYEIAADVDASIAKGDPVSVRQITLIRLALNNATTAAAEAAAFAYHAAGGVALRQGALQRGIRDMMAASQHKIVSDFMLRECARDLLGQAKGQVWTTGAGGSLNDPPLSVAAPAR
jgi:alkylation response protein AidB-like acyl-CoA dehydrogenase